MKKRIFCVLLLVCVLLVQAAAFSNPPIVDDAGYLFQSELAELSAQLDALRNEYDFEVAIYTESAMSGYSAEASADDIYDYLGYGGGANDDGILLYICSDTREYHFTTHGTGLTAFNQNGLSYLESKVVPHLSEDDYYAAFEAYIETAEELLTLAASGTPYDKKPLKNVAFILIVCLLLPLLIAFFKMHGKLKQMKTAVENNEAANYIKHMNLSVSRDLFLYSHITKTEIPKSNSGTHTSSSGRTHGGSGGSF